MRKIKEILRLRYEAKLSLRGVSESLNIGYGTVVDYIKRAERAELSWPIPDDLDERDLGLLLFPTQALTGQRRFAEPDFLSCYSDLKKSKTVTRHLLWQEYRQQHPEDGYSCMTTPDNFVDKHRSEHQVIPLLVPTGVSGYLIGWILMFRH